MKINLKYQKSVKFYLQLDPRCPHNSDDGILLSFHAFGVSLKNWHRSTYHK